MHNGPTEGAVRAAKIIMHGRRSKSTDLGIKSIIGVADIIDDETGAKGLRVACEAAIKLLLRKSDDWVSGHREESQVDLFSVLGMLKAALKPSDIKSDTE